MQTTGLQSPTPNLYVDNQDGSGDIIQITQPPSNSSVPTSPLTTHPLLSHHQAQQRPISFNNAKASTLDPNWQANKISIRERNAAMFNNELMADIFFVVGPPGMHARSSLTLACQCFQSKSQVSFFPIITKGGTQTIPAHKYVLATGSSVFHAMFFGGLAESEAQIEVPDVEPAAFLTLLK